MALAAAQAVDRHQRLHRLRDQRRAPDASTIRTRTATNTTSARNDQRRYGLLAEQRAQHLLYFAAAADAMSTDPNCFGQHRRWHHRAIRADQHHRRCAAALSGRFFRSGNRARPHRGARRSRISAPLCTACGIEPFAIAPVDATDTVNFGFTIGTEYTFGYQCTGTPTPAPLTGTAISAFLI